MSSPATIHFRPQWSARTGATSGVLCRIRSGPGFHPDDRLGGRRPDPLGHDVIRRNIEDFKAALNGVAVEGAFMPAAAPASVAPDRLDEHYRNEEESLFAIAEALREEYKAIVDAGFTLQIDEAYLATTYEVMFPRERWRISANGRRCVSKRSSRNQRFVGRPDALSHVLGQLERPAYLRPGDERYRRPDAPGARRRLRHREGQSAPRARMAAMGERQLPQGKVLLPA
jgi:hypothetical protein